MHGGLGVATKTIRGGAAAIQSVEGPDCAFDVLKDLHTPVVTLARRPRTLGGRRRWLWQRQKFRSGILQHILAAWPPRTGFPCRNGWDNRLCPPEGPSLRGPRLLFLACPCLGSLHGLRPRHWLRRQSESPSDLQSAIGVAARQTRPPLSRRVAPRHPRPARPRWALHRPRSRWWTDARREGSNLCPRRRGLKRSIRRRASPLLNWKASLGSRALSLL